jgi:putative membrane protein
MPPSAGPNPGYAPAGYPPATQQGATYEPHYQGNPYPPPPGAVPAPAGYPGPSGPSTGAPAAMPPGATAPTDEYYKPPKVV